MEERSRSAAMLGIALLGLIGAICLALAACLLGLLPWVWPAYLCGGLLGVAVGTLSLWFRFESIDAIVAISETVTQGHEGQPLAPSGDDSLWVGAGDQG